LERGGIGSMYPALESERVWLCELIVEGVIMTPSESEVSAAIRFGLAWLGLVRFDSRGMGLDSRVVPSARS
jgi:hypothetical protein